MSIQEIQAREKVQMAFQELRLLDAIKDKLTAKGLKHYNELKSFVDNNFYLLD